MTSPNKDPTPQGGSLTDMAVSGTSVSQDSEPTTHRVIPSVPRPDQATQDAAGGLGASTTAVAADNATDMPRNPRDPGENSEVITGIGDQMPGQAVSGKRAHEGGGNALAKGSDRYDKHTKSHDTQHQEVNDDLEGDGVKV